jgi:hypothetical protein
MKNLLLITLFISCVTALTAQSADESAIQKVCEAETRAWLEKDAATFNNCWQIRPYSRIIVTTEDGQTFSIGADQLKAATTENMAGDGGTFANSNYQIHVDGNSAWTTYDEVKTDAAGAHPSYEMRLLEKVNGVWKIVGMSVHHYKPK